jgi:hypothetical protein
MRGSTGMFVALNPEPELKLKFENLPHTMRQLVWLKKWI